MKGKQPALGWVCHWTLLSLSWAESRGLPTPSMSSLYHDALSHVFLEEPFLMFGVGAVPQEGYKTVTTERLPLSLNAFIGLCVK